MTTQTAVNCPYCEKPIPAKGGHVCADSTKSFLTAHNCHDAVQPLTGAYPGDTAEERMEGEH